MPNRRFFHRRDIWVAAGLAAVALLWMWLTLRPPGGTGGLSAEVYVGGELVEAVELDTDRTFSVVGLPNVVLAVEGGSIFFVSSDCPDRDCIRMGPQGAAGGFAACLPNKVLVQVVQQSAGVDTVAR